MAIYLILQTLPLLLAAPTIYGKGLGYGGIKVHLPPSYPTYSEPPIYKKTSKLPQPKPYPNFMKNYAKPFSSQYSDLPSIKKGLSVPWGIGIDKMTPANPTVPGYPQYGYPMRTSPNDVVNGSALVSPWDAAMWDHPLDEDVCRNLGGLTAAQMMLCTRNVEVAGAAAIGLGMAVRECRRQFANHRWNCTALTTPSNNPSSAPIMHKGYSESAFGHAITAAGVTHAVARACSAGRLANCSCGQVRGRRAWKWSGCHDNTRFGARFSRQFLDIREKAKDIVSFTHIFNNEVGRKVVRRNREVRCKCHGMSGSCEMRTCWKAAPDFRHVGDILKKKYEVAKSAASEVFGDAANSARRYRPVRRQITPESPLLYVERSPTYCSSDDRLDVEGTLGRLCNHTSSGADSCTTICCGRGYSLTKQKVTFKCNCRFKWCCDVTCQDCSEERWIAVCK